MKRTFFHLILMLCAVGIASCRFHQTMQPAQQYISIERNSDGSINAQGLRVVTDSAELALIQRMAQAEITYDTVPQFRLPQLKREATNYDESDYNTFAIYTHPHTVAAQPYKTSRLEKMAIWCTPEATYLAVIDEQNWTSKYYHAGKDQYLRDCKTGNVYPILGYIGYPLGQTVWIEGVAGEWHCRVMIFPPLPKHCTTIDIMSGGERLKKIEGTTGWTEPEDHLGVKVAVLQAQQPITIYKETVVVE